VVHRIEKLPDVELKDPARTLIITAGLSYEFSQSSHGRMRPLPDTARIAVEYERTLKNRLKDTVDSVMGKPVANCRLVDDPMLRIENVEPVVWPVLVSAENKVIAQSKDIVLQIAFEILNVKPASLAAPKFAPGGKQIL